MPVMKTEKYLMGLHPFCPMLIMRLLCSGKLYRKLLTAKRVQAVNLKRLKNELEWAKGNDFNDIATKFQEIEKFFADYKTRVNDNICDPEIKAQLLSDVEDLFDRVTNKEICLVRIVFTYAYSVVSFCSLGY